MAKLTAKQKAFVAHYTRSLNGTDAARRAGYRGTYDSLRVIASQNLTKPHIRRAIDDMLRENAMSAAEVLSRLSDQARGAPADCFTVYGPTIAFDFEKLKQHGLLHLVKKISYNSDGHPIVELYSSQRALESLGKVHALFVDRSRVEDWRSDAIEYIRRGEVSYKALADEFGTDLATELFTIAGVPVDVEPGTRDDNYK